MAILRLRIIWVLKLYLNLTQINLTVITVHVLSKTAQNMWRPRNFKLNIWDALSLEICLVCLELKLWIFNTQQLRYNTEHLMAPNSPKQSILSFINNCDSPTHFLLICSYQAFWMIFGQKKEFYHVMMIRVPWKQYRNKGILISL